MTLCLERLQQPIMANCPPGPLCEGLKFLQCHIYISIWLQSWMSWKWKFCAHLHTNTKALWSSSRRGSVSAVKQGEVAAADSKSRKQRQQSRKVTALPIWLRYLFDCAARWVKIHSSLVKQQKVAIDCCETRWLLVLIPKVGSRGSRAEKFLQWQVSAIPIWLCS